MLFTLDRFANSATASADFLVFFLQFFRCSNVSVGTNVGRTVKPSPNAESTMGKFLKWFAASLAVSPFSLSCSICLANFALFSVSHDVTKIQTKKLSPPPSFYFHVILEHLKIFTQTNFRFKRVLCFAIQDAWISRLLRDASFSWRPGKLLCGLKTLRIFGDFVI